MFNLDELLGGLVALVVFKLVLTTSNYGSILLVYY